MRISELSRQSGVPLPTIKYYLREGLLPPGERSGPNQAEYGERHVRRLGAIRALREVAGLGIEPIRGIVAAIDDPEMPLIGLLARLADSTGAHGTAAGAGLEGPRADVDGLIERLGWRVREDSAVRDRLAELLVALRRTHIPELPAEAFISYAEAVFGIAEMESAYFRGDVAAGRDAAVEGAVVGTVLWEQVLTSLRRAAHEHFTHEMLG